VPFFKQDDYQCGPSALATVIDYWYIRKAIPEKLTVEEIVAAIYSPSARGVLSIDLENYARSKGFRAKQYEGSIADIKRKVESGLPLILFVEYGFSLYKLNHFVVAKGYTEEGVIVNSGRKENEIILNAELNKIWGKTGYWSLLIKPSY
jgi:predicted double-glycine peptidase